VPKVENEIIFHFSVEPISVEPIMKIQHTSFLTRRDFLTSLGLFGVGFVSSNILFTRNTLPTDSSIPEPGLKSDITVNNKATTTGYVYDPLFLKHTESWHPESAKRLEAIMAELKASGLLASLQQIPSRAATFDEVASVHSISHIEHVKEISQAGGGYLDPDTYTNSYTYEAAMMAAGSLIDLTLAVIAGQVKNGFAFVRPPGHHALSHRTMGFCIFNNVAIAVKLAQVKQGLERIAIVDFDVHHGNGTQAIFEEDPGVLYISTHQYPHYPGTGRAQEIGRGQGEGTIVNIPLPAGVGDDGFRAIYTELIIPLLRWFKPQLMIVSAGYDCHWDDPLAGLGLSLTGLAWISQTLVTLAAELCAGKVVFVLEGGYDLKVLSIGVANSVRALLGRDDFADPLGKSPRREPDLTEYLATVKKIHKVGASQ
jgi:acetoin utilization deacetylase AcuC-like enzyme